MQNIYLTQVGRPVSAIAYTRRLDAFSSGSPPNSTGKPWHDPLRCRNLVVWQNLPKGVRTTALSGEAMPAIDLVARYRHGSASCAVGLAY